VSLSVGAASEAWVARYEQLRGGMLEPQVSDHGHGLTLFLRAGMAAWIEAWSPCLPTHTPVVVSAPKKVSSLPQGLQREMVHLLANIALNRLQGAYCREVHA
jgi:hypothetical protein